MKKLSIASFTNVGYFWHARRFEPIDTDMTGKVVAITGATGGLGFETAETLAGLGARVVIVGRNRDKLDSAARSIGQNAMPFRADLSLMADVRNLAADVLDSVPRVDVLINNVGVLLPERSETVEGLETTFATNLAGQFLLTNLLLPRLVGSAPARVVNITSGGMYSQRLHPTDLQNEIDSYSGSTAYARTKRAQVIVTKEWAKRLDPAKVAFHSMHPGWSATAGVQGSLPVFYKLMRPLLRNTAQGADTIVWLASADEPGKSGSFWFDRGQAPLHLMDSTRETGEDRALLWDQLVEITGSDVPGSLVERR